VGELPTVAISIRQPWAFAIIHGGKDIENRTWRTKYRGPVLVHASKGMTRDEWDDFREFIHGADLRGDWCAGKRPADLQRGGVVGVVDIIDCVREHPSPWFFGPVGFVLANPRPLEFRPCRGALGFFTPEPPMTPALSALRTDETRDRREVGR
jgi:hypothetical protein